MCHRLLFTPCTPLPAEPLGASRVSHRGVTACSKGLVPAVQYEPSPVEQAEFPNLESLLAPKSSAQLCSAGQAPWSK